MTSGGRPPTALYVEHVMGMPISLALRGRHADEAPGRAAWSEAMAVLRAADHVFSTYRPDSVVSRPDRGELTVADYPPEVAEVLALGAAAERDSGGAFSVHRAAAPLRALADTNFCLSAGGDLVCRTVDPDRRPWRIGIEDPHDPRRVIAVVPIATGAVATSGSAHRGRHVVDARTGLPPSGIASVTVVAAFLLDADIDATAAYAQGPGAAAWLGTRTGRSGLVVRADGSTSTVRGAATVLPAAVGQP